MNAVRDAIALAFASFDRRTDTRGAVIMSDAVLARGGGVHVSITTAHATICYLVRDGIAVAVSREVAK